MSISVALQPQSAIPNLTTLESTVADWLDRDDLAARIPMFIQLAEAMFNRELRTPEMEQTATLTLSGQDNPLPSDFLAMRSIYLYGSPNLPLQALSPSAIAQTFDGTPGTPVAYALVSESIRLAPPPAAASQFTMDYFAKIIPLSAVSPSNWLLAEHPDAYLYGTLYFAEQLLDNATRVQQWGALLDQVIQRIRISSAANRFGSGPIAPLPANQVHGVSC